MNQKNYKDKEKNEAYSKYMKLIGPLKKEKNIKEIAYMILLFEENIPKSEFINTIKKLKKYKLVLLFNFWDVSLTIPYKKKIKNINYKYI